MQIIFIFLTLFASKAVAENQALSKEYLRNLTGCLDDLDMGTCSSGLGIMRNDGYGRVALIRKPGTKSDEVFYFSYGKTGGSAIKVCKPPVVERRGPSGDRIYFFLKEDGQKSSRLGVHDEIYFNDCKHSNTCPTKAKENCRELKLDEYSQVSKQIRDYVVERLESRPKWLKDYCGRRKNEPGIGVDFIEQIDPYDRCVGTTKALGFLMIHHPEAKLKNIKTDKEILKTSQSQPEEKINLPLIRPSAARACLPKSAKCQNIDWGNEILQYSKVEKVFDVSCGLQQPWSQTSKKVASGCSPEGEPLKYCPEDRSRLYFSGASLFAQAQKCLGQSKEQQKNQLQAIKLMGGFQLSEGVGESALRDIQAHGLPELADKSDQCKKFVRWATGDQNRCIGGRPSSKQLGAQIIQSGAYLQLLGKDISQQLSNHPVFGEIKNLSGYGERAEADLSLLAFQFGIGRISRLTKKILLDQKEKISSSEELFKKLKLAVLAEIDQNPKTKSKSSVWKEKRRQLIDKGFSSVGKEKDQCFSK